MLFAVCQQLFSFFCFSFFSGFSRIFINIQRKKQQLREGCPPSELQYTMFFQECQANLCYFLKQFYLFFSRHKICYFSLILSIFCGSSPRLSFLLLSISYLGILEIVYPRSTILQQASYHPQNKIGNHVVIIQPGKPRTCRHLSHRLCAKSRTGQGCKHQAYDP